MVFTFNVVRNLTALLFNLLEIKKRKYGLLTTYVLRRIFAVSEHARLILVHSAEVQ